MRTGLVRSGRDPQRGRHLGYQPKRHSSAESFPLFFFLLASEKAGPPNVRGLAFQ